MTLPLFPVDSDALESGASIVLAGQEGRHAGKVMRLRIGEQLTVTDGRGRYADAVVEQVDGDLLHVRLVQAHREPPPQPKLTVFQALPKADRGETASALLTEIGVDEIVPWQASRCVVQWRDDNKKARGQHKWAQASQAAAKQSRRVWWPTISEVASTDEVVRRIPSSDLAVVLDEGAKEPLARVVAPTTGEVALVVGPEGGLTIEELEQFREAGAVLGSLGPTILRASTAGAVGAAVLLSTSARWSPP